MYKSKLQELCFEKSWALPQYSAIRKGPEHIPQFRASVFIKGEFYHAQTCCGSLKEAQNQAAMAAFTHFSPSVLTHVSVNSNNFESSESLGEPNEALANDVKCLGSLPVQESVQDCRASNICTLEMRKIYAMDIDNADFMKGKGKLIREDASDAQA